MLVVIFRSLGCCASLATAFLYFANSGYLYLDTSEEPSVAVDLTVIGWTYRPGLTVAGSSAGRGRFPSIVGMTVVVQPANLRRFSDSHFQPSPEICDPGRS